MLLKGKPIGHAGDVVADVTPDILVAVGPLVKLFRHDFGIVEIGVEQVGDYPF